MIVVTSDLERSAATRHFHFFFSRRSVICKRSIAKGFRVANLLRRGRGGNRMLLADRKVIYREYLQPLSAVDDILSKHTYR